MAKNLRLAEVLLFVYITTMNSLSRQFLPLTISLFLISCHNNQGRNRTQDPATIHSTDSLLSKTADRAQASTIDDTLFRKYQEAYQKDTSSYDTVFLSKLLAIVKKFNGKKMDTTLLTIGNIDGDMGKDTIFSRVYYHPDSIYVDSKWIKDNKILWNYKYTNPYYSFYSDLLNYDPTTINPANIWEVFSIGVIYGSPEFEARLEIENDDTAAHNMVIEAGIDDLKEAGIKIDTADYKKYLRNFKGNPIGFGNPEGREGLWIWYQPARRFITYFQP